MQLQKRDRFRVDVYQHQALRRLAYICSRHVQADCVRIGMQGAYQNLEGLHRHLLSIWSAWYVTKMVKRSQWTENEGYLARGIRREVLRGFTKSSWGSGGGGRCEPPAGSGAVKINAFQRLRTPVSLSFLSQCCYTKIHAIFFIHSHSHHFQLNEVVPNHTL